jgi:hypothetical protein
MSEPQRATTNYVIGVSECSQQCRVFKGVGYNIDSNAGATRANGCDW